MTSLANVRRRRTALMLAFNLVVLVAVAGLAYRGAKAIAHYQGATNAATPTVKIPATPIALLGTTDGDNRLSSLTLFVAKPNGEAGGTIVSVPVSVDASGGIGVQTSLADTYKAGGPGSLYDDVDSVLGLTVDSSRILDPDALQAFLKPLEPFAVDLPTTVSTTSNGQTVPLYARGPNSFNAFKWATSLNARVDGFSERSRRPTLEALWKGFAASVNKGVVQPKAGLPAGSVEAIINQVLSGHVDTRVLPANRYSLGILPPDSDVERLDHSEELLVMAALAPASMSAANAGLSFRIEAPVGQEAKVKSAIDVLTFLRGNIRSVYIGTPTHPSTYVYAYDQQTAGKLMDSMKVFGAIEAKQPDYKIDGVDVVLQLGDSPIGDPAKYTTTTSLVPGASTDGSGANGVASSTTVKG